MTEPITIPLNQLIQWKGNVRKTAPMEALEELIASLSSHGLLQSLVVHPASDNGKTKGTFWNWCLTQDRDTLIALLTYCAALSIDATQRKQDKPDSFRLRHAARLAEALKLDMAEYFKPDATNYFSRISKDMIVADLKDATGKDASPAILKMKKSELANHAAKAVAQTNWLPAILRLNTTQD